MEEMARKELPDEKSAKPVHTSVYLIQFRKWKSEIPSLGHATPIIWENPILMNGLLYFLKVNNGYLTCLNAKDGTEYYTNLKLEGIKNIFTSPVGVNDRIYIAGTNGSFSVVKTGETFELLS